MRSWGHFPYFQKAEAEGPHVRTFSASFSQRVREEESKDPQRAAVNRTAQKDPDVGSGDLG